MPELTDKHFFKLKEPYSDEEIDILEKQYRGRNEPTEVSSHDSHWIPTVRGLQTARNEVQDRIVEWYKCPECGQPVPCKGYISPVGECLCGYMLTESNQDKKLDLRDYIAGLQTALRKERKERIEAEEAAVFHHKAQDKLHLRITALQSILLDHQYRFTWTVDDGDIVICIECLAHTRIKFDENLNDIVKRIKCKPDCKIASTLEPSDPDHADYITARDLKKEEQ